MIYICEPNIHCTHKHYNKTSKLRSTNNKEKLLLIWGAMSTIQCLLRLIILTHAIHKGEHMQHSILNCFAQDLGYSPGHPPGNATWCMHMYTVKVKFRPWKLQTRSLRNVENLHNEQWTKYLVPFIYMQTCVKVVENLSTRCQNDANSCSVT